MKLLRAERIQKRRDRTKNADLRTELQIYKLYDKIMLDKII